MLRHRTENKPEAPLYTFLRDGEEDAVTLHCGDLDRKARILGAKLQEMGLEGERAVLLYRPGLDYISGFFGCLYGKVLAVPVYPPDPNRLELTLPRLLAIIKNCQAKLLLTTQEILSMAGFLSSQYPEFNQIQWLASDTLEEDYADIWKEPTLEGDSIAFLQYTSGSTGNPKGIKLSHGNLLHNLRLIIKELNISPEEDTGISWLPPYHDLGLIGGVLLPLFGQEASYLMSPLHFLEKPIRWLKLFSKTQRPIISGGPNFAYELCVQTITPEQRDSLCLSHWKAAILGAEPIRKDTLDKFANYFGSSGFKKSAFCPGYGLAEATLMVSVCTPGQGYRTQSENPNSIVVSCGPSSSEQSIRIVDPKNLSLVKDGEIGEIWVRGASIAKGYWGDDDLSEVTFNNFLNGHKEGPYLRTGDLGFLNKGELFVTGRLKDLIIIRGMNHYPQDIERTLEACHPAFRPGCGAAFSMWVDGEEQLVLIQELTKESYQESTNLNFSELVATIREAITLHHNLEVFATVLIVPSSIPKTASGKISRHFCKLAFQENSLKTVHLWKKQSKKSPLTLHRRALDPQLKEKLLKLNLEDRKIIIDTQIRSRISQILEIDPSSLELNQTLSTLGLDSLMFLQLKNELETSLGIPLSIESLLKPGFGLLDLSKLIAGQLR